LVGGRGPRLERTGAGDSQLAERFHGPVAGLGDHGGVTGEHSSRRGFGVDAVGLAAPTAGLTVRSVHLQHVEPAGPEVPAQSRSPGAGALDADGEDLAVAGDPAGQAPVAVGGRRERPRVEQPAELVEHGSDVEVFVGVDTGDDSPVLDQLCDGGHAALSLHRVGGGTHGREGGQDREWAW